MTQQFINATAVAMRVVERRTGRYEVEGPLHDFPLAPGQSVTIHRRKGVRLCWRKA